MSFAEAAVPRALTITTKVLYRAVEAAMTVVENSTITAGLSELQMVSDFFRNRSWVFAQLSADAFERLPLYQPLFNDDSVFLS
jgi:hypothetical protein